jgi:hypothetical protein
MPCLALPCLHSSHLASPRSPFPSRQNYHVDLRERQRQPPPPIDPVRWPVPHREMQFHGGELSGRKARREVWRQPLQKIGNRRRGRHGTLIRQAVQKLCAPEREVFQRHRPQRTGERECRRERQKMRPVPTREVEQDALGETDE